MTAIIEAFFHKPTSTLSYVVYDMTGGHCAVIDSVLDFDLSSGIVSTEFADQIIDFIRSNQLTLDWILETHAHADHLTAASYIKSKLGGVIAAGGHIVDVQATFESILVMDDDGVQSRNSFDHRFQDKEEFSVGMLTAEVLETPGHTSDSVTYLVDEDAFIGDTLFMPDFGSARCDFPGGDAKQLFASIQRIYALPDSTRIFVCHDYQPGGRELQYQTTVGVSKADNIHITGDTPEREFVQFRSERDKQLNVPKLLYPAIQVNIRAGQLPKAFIKIPISKTF
ncbi:MBL fold metallo-hydrolase [Photobacterium lutimaris]|uniref:MBL fold metallo-hydrolase n=2 Tax=Photobacterium lutimaris TaxID=388278 RepID=A0A2T3J3H9_9GAMM|nr:MBL fold metallo-hydrolase [Photobacterium lutimaris]TDR78874.1 glyoxylase-like metal-dependent hydrolase (beta-lactamase superfamily II) [Photobacterium lutimaris]